MAMSKECTSHLVTRFPCEDAVLDPHAKRQTVSPNEPERRHAASFFTDMKLLTIPIRTS